MKSKTWTVTNGGCHLILREFAKITVGTYAYRIIRKSIVSDLHTVCADPDTIGRYRYLPVRLPYLVLQDANPDPGLKKALFRDL